MFVLALFQIVFGRFGNLIAIAALGGLVATLSGCQTGERRSAGEEFVPHVVTGDIQAGIESHIKRQIDAGGGYFHLPYDGGELRLKLVRIHTEYLATLGPRRHFACVDLANVDGNVYDVDFFLEGDPGAMTVTQTIVHKRNGQPFYLWRQNEEGRWVRASVEGAPNALLGVIQDADSFEFLYQAKLPEFRESARLWLPLPTSDAYQTIEVKSIRVPGQHQTLTEKRYGNKVLLVTLDGQDSGKPFALRFHVQRREKGPYRDPASRPGEFLAPERLVPITGEFSEIASEITAGITGDLARARALYDYTIERMRYMKYGAGWGKGDAVYACGTGTGNCTDYHSYFVALLRAAGIPARFAIGAAIPSERDEGGIDGYHCWAEFYAEGMWWPVDLSEADKYAALSTYYFGHHPANRIELSRGRDLVVEPGPASGSINFLAYPLLEIAGKEVEIKPQFSFVRGGATANKRP